METKFVIRRFMTIVETIVKVSLMDSHVSKMVQVDIPVQKTRLLKL